jgi:hypothetical protein
MMMQLVVSMEREGLVVRLIDREDERATLVAITDAGGALRDELRQSAHGRTAELLDMLSRRRGDAGLGDAPCDSNAAAADLPRCRTRQCEPAAAPLIA